MKAHRILVGLVALTCGCSSIRGVTTARFVVDGSVPVQTRELPAFTDGATRRVVGVQSGNIVTEFVRDELIVHPKDAASLAAFLQRFGATVLHDDKPEAIPGLADSRAVPARGRYLVRVDLQRAPADLEARARAAGVHDRYKASSEDALKLLAIAFASTEVRAAPNLILRPLTSLLEISTREHPTAAGGNLETGTWPWMTAPGQLLTGNLNIGVIRAWAYLRYKGIGTGGTTWNPPILAIIDSGFDIDASTGAPGNGNLDYHFLGTRPLQIDVVDHDGIASGANTIASEDGGVEPWHGQLSFGTAAAYPRNVFGSAGTGGEFVRPLLVRTDSTVEGTTNGIRSAVLNGASVINISSGTATACPTDDLCESLYFSVLANMQEAMNLAASYGVIVVSGAGNSMQLNDSTFSFVPCTLDHVICVGAIMPAAPARAESYSGRGSKVSIWAPDCTRSTPTPSSIAAVATPTDPFSPLPRYCGTSAAAPFTAGIVALLKAMRPGMGPAEVRAQLQETALTSADPLVTPGYVNALGALMDLAPNEPPTVSIKAPAVGESPIWNTTTSLWAEVSDPEQTPEPATGPEGLSVNWRSDIQGELGKEFFTAAKLSFGTHQLTLTAADPFGASAATSRVVQTSKVPPSAFIPYPFPNAAFCDSQSINLRGVGTSPSQFLVDSDYVWTSNISGVVGTGHDAWVNLPAGIHQITLTVTDLLSQTATAAVSIGVRPNIPSCPTVRITSPVEVYAPVESPTFTFEGSATDPVDGTLPDSGLTWFSNVDGPLGTGHAITATLSHFATCGSKRHIITLQGRNSAGGVATHAITIDVGNIC